MGFAVKLESSTAGAERRAAARTHIRLIAAIARADEPVVIVHDISPTGMLLETPADLSSDERLTVEIAQGFLATARIVWRSGQFFGCQFEQPLSRAAISAARLRSAIEPAVAAPSEAAAPDDDLTVTGSKLPRTTRFAIIVAAALLCWAGVLSLAWLVI